MAQYKGFIDIQNNGWMGTDFSEANLQTSRVLEITRELVEKGTLAYLPTVITTSEENFQHNLGAIADAMDDPQWGRHILGIHVEGPFLNPKPGAVGAHPKEHVKTPDVKLFQRMQEWARGRIKICSVAPEFDGAEELIRYATGQGVTITFAHHLASDEDMERGLKAGATIHNHVGNGIPNEIHRHQNPLWYVLSNDDLYGLFITDGHHLPDDLIKVAVRTKRPERMVITSDAAPLAGMPPGKYVTFGNLNVVISEDGLIYSEESKSLAGSHSTMLECMNYLASLNLLSEEELWQVGYLNPLKVINISPDAVADLPGPGVSFRNGRFELGN